MNCKPTEVVEIVRPVILKPSDVTDSEDPDDADSMPEEAFPDQHKRHHTQCIPGMDPLTWRTSRLALNL